MQPVSFWSFFWRCLDHATMDTAHFFGWDLRTVLVAVGLVALGFFMHWKIKGPSATREEVSKFLIITAAPLVIFVIGLFLYNIFRAPYLVYLAEFSKAEQRIQNAEGERAKAQSARQAAEDTIRELEKQLAQRSALSRSAQKSDSRVTTSSVSPQDHEKERRLEMRTQLARFLGWDNTLKQLCLADPPPPKFSCVDQANSWLSEARSYISKNLEPSYLPRFDAATGASLSYNAAKTTEINNVVNFLTFKAAILEEFIREFRD